MRGGKTSGKKLNLFLEKLKNANKSYLDLMLINAIATKNKFELICGKENHDNESDEIKNLRPNFLNILSIFTDLLCFWNESFATSLS